MSFFERLVSVGKKAINVAAEQGLKAQETAMKRSGEMMLGQEKKLEQYGRQKHKMNPEQLEKYEHAKEAFDRKKEKMQGSGVAYNTRGETTINGRTLSEWEGSWESIGLLSSANLTPYNDSVGIYQHKYGGKIVYIGRAIELNNGGFRKRLSDYRRDSDSSRKHKSGQLIHQHLDSITTSVLVVGKDQAAVQATVKLEKYFIGKYQPEWNKMFR